MKEFHCGSLVPGCDWHTRHDEEAEVMRRAVEHMRETREQGRRWRRPEPEGGERDDEPADHERGAQDQRPAPEGNCARSGAAGSAFERRLEPAFERKPHVADVGNALARILL